MGVGRAQVSETALPKRAKGERPRYFDDPASEKTLAIVMALTGEVAVMRDRLDTVERLLERGEPITRAAITAYAPDETVRADRDVWREEYLSIVLRIVHQEREALSSAARAGSQYADALDLVNATA